MMCQLFEERVEFRDDWARWIFKNEFQLLLRLAGFALGIFRHARRRPAEIGLDETRSYWIIDK